MTFRELDPGTQLDRPGAADPAPATGTPGRFRELAPGTTLDQPGKAAADPNAGGAWSAFGKGALHGVGNILWGAGQLAGHVLPGGLSETIDKAAQERETAYQKDPTIRAHPWASTAGDIAGEIVGTAPLDFIPGVGPAAMAATRIGRYGRAALKGAEIGGLEPVTGGKDDYWTEKMKQSGLGAAGGAVGERIFGRAGSAIAPRVDPDVTRLGAEGVRMTPGQLATGATGHMANTLRRAEEVLKNWPVLGEFIRAGQTRSIEDFNISTINQALEPIGVRLPQGINVGRDAIGWAQRAASAAYDQVLTPLRFQADNRFFNNVGFQYLGGGGGIRILQGPNLINPVTRLHTPAMQREFQQILRARVLNRIDPRTGMMDGRTLKEVESELGNLAFTYQRSNDGAQRLIGQSVRDLQEEIRDSLERQNPRAAADLRNANLTYAMMARVNNAAGSRGATPEGVFRPTDLMSAARAGDRTRMKAAFARGDALMQTWATAGQRILPGKMPDSGTPERLQWLRVIGRILAGTTAVGAAGHVTGTLPHLVAGTALASLPYTQLGQRAVQGYALSGARRAALRDPTSGIASYIGDPAMAAIFAGQPEKPRQSTLTMIPPTQ